MHSDIKNCGAEISKLSAAIHLILLIAALVSGALAVTAQLHVCSDWRKSSAEIRNDMILGVFAAPIYKVKASVPEQDGIILYSSVDPALLPYALFPRKIWQTQTDPETNSAYMDLPPSSYPAISPGERPVSWQLDIDQNNIMIGGDLSRIPHGGSR